jgi:hypothetical protein
MTEVVEAMNSVISEKYKYVGLGWWDIGITGIIYRSHLYCNMSIHRRLFQWNSTIQMQLSVLV